jgi:hypothetical protein
MTKKMYCTLDTETVGGCTNPTGFYHIGGFIHDREGNIYASFNMVVANMFEEIRNDDYAKRNFHLYEEYITTGEATVVATQEEAVTLIDHLCDFYNVTTMMAFNSGFDFGKTKAKLLIDNRDFIDIYLMALQTIGQKKSYINFCRKNNLLSRSKKCIASTAESFYAYLTNNPQYCEEHTALEDSKIEMEIFIASLRTHKKFTQNCVLYDFEDKYALFVPAEEA